MLNCEKNLDDKYKEILQREDVNEIVSPTRKALYLNSIFGIPKRLLCDGKESIISYHAFARAEKSSSLGYEPGVSGRRPRLNLRQEVVRRWGSWRNRSKLC
jgi:hypothetical protein